ncbi:MAG: hypothetical protein DLM58_16320 [Pseudonocardiales bacterium]|nr:MAG: hypothetical protein DLM58_16320 [Pseudonocardiales bacterium]
MSYIVRGRLCGYLCDDCDEPLAGSVVRFYSSEGDQTAARAAAQPKDTMILRASSDVEALAGRFVGEATVAPDGSYEAKMSAGYSGGELDVDIYCGSVPTSRPPKHKTEPVQFHVTTIAPAWREAEDVRVAAFEYCVPARIWCAIRARFGVWVICGHVLVCESKQPVAGVTVKAFDVDWLQDDMLGSAVTDAAGHFRIDYLAADFKRTPFSPLINIEWVSGPDLYFRVESAGGAPLLVEPASKGRTPGRENVGPCTCVELCLTGDVPSTPPTIPMFTKVGVYRIDPIYGEFTPNGTTTSGDMAFTSTIPLVGIMPDPLSSDAIEYRFQIATLPAGPVPVDVSHIGATIIGELEFFAYDSVLSAWVVRSTDFWANNAGATVSIPQNGAPDLVVGVNTPVNADGWIAAPRVNSLVPGGQGRFIPNGTLAILDTTTYTDESFDLAVAAPPLPLTAGDSVPAAQQSTMPLCAITFEARVVTVHTPVGTNTLAKIAFSNLLEKYDRHPYWAGGTTSTIGVGSLGIAEMASAGGCAEMGDSIHALYTAYHPYIGQPRIYLEGNPILPAEIDPVTASGQAVSAPGGDLIDITLLAKCAYILWLSVPLRLTSGYGSLGWHLEDHIAFCKK